MTVKKHILKSESISQHYSIGMVSSDSILQLSMNLNNTLNLSFKLSSPLFKPKSENLDFPCCSHHVEDSLLCYLIKNKHNGISLFTPFQSIDYILIITDKDAEQLLNKIQTSYKEMSSISAVMPIEIKKLKNLKEILPSY